MFFIEYYIALLQIVFYLLLFCYEAINATENDLLLAEAMVMPYIICSKL